MGSGSSIVLTPVVEKMVTLTIQTPNLLALMDSDGHSGLAYQLLYKEWTAGVDSVHDVQYMHVFHLNERPFSSPLLNLGKAHITAGGRARQSFCHLLGRFDELGIKLVTSVYTGKIFCRSTLFFEKRLTTIETNPDKRMATLVCPAEERFICVAMRSKNILQFPMVSAMGRIHLDWIRNEFGSHITSDENLGEFIEFTFKGQPFGNTSRYEEMITSKRLFLGLVRHFGNAGYEFSAGLSLRGGFKNDTMFFKSTRRVPNTETNYFLLCPEEKCHLRIFEAPVEAAEVIKASIPSGQIREIKQSYMGCIEIILHGNPFECTDSELADTQLQFLDIIDRLWRVGWELRGAVQTSLGVYDKTGLLFETSNEMSRPIFGISMACSDTIKLFKVTANVRTLIREMILGMWSKGIQSEYDIKSGYAIKLKGRPFGSRDIGADSNEGLHLLACIVEKLRLIGWQLQSSMDFGAKLMNVEESAYSYDGPMIIFIRERLSESNDNNKIHGAI